MTYKEKLKDRRWQMKRAEIMARDKGRCQLSYLHDGYMVIHHKVYKPGFEPWDYDNDDLITLCQECHSKIVLNKTTRNCDCYKWKSFLLSDLKSVNRLLSLFLKNKDKMELIESAISKINSTLKDIEKQKEKHVITNKRKQF